MFEGKIISASVKPAERPYTPESAAAELAARQKSALEATRYTVASKWLRAIEKTYLTPSKPRRGRLQKDVAALKRTLSAYASISVGPPYHVIAVEVFMTLKLPAESFAIVKKGTDTLGRPIVRRLVTFQLKKGETIAQAVHRRAKEIVENGRAEG